MIEAGLGGRLDATNTIPSQVTVLTSVGLDHTEWLGDTEEEIAAEKLAVLRDDSTLVLGRVSEPVRELAERTAAERGAALLIAPEDPGEGIRLARPRPVPAPQLRPRLHRRGGLPRPARPGARRRGRRRPDGPRPARAGREDSPPTYLDAAHNVDAAAALAEALPEVAGDAPVIACLAMLADKDAEGAVAALAPALERVVCTEIPAETLRSQGRPGAAGHPADDLARICRAAGLEAEAEPDLVEALARARELRRRRATASSSSPAPTTCWRRPAPRSRLTADPPPASGGVSRHSAGLHRKSSSRPRPCGSRASRRGSGYEDLTEPNVRRFRGDSA